MSRHLISLSTLVFLLAGCAAGGSNNHSTNFSSDNCEQDIRERIITDCFFQQSPAEFEKYDRERYDYLNQKGPAIAEPDDCSTDPEKAHTKECLDKLKAANPD